MLQSRTSVLSVAGRAVRQINDDDDDDDDDDDRDVYCRAQGLRMHIISVRNAKPCCTQWVRPSPGVCSACQWKTALLTLSRWVTGSTPACGTVLRKSVFGIFKPLGCGVCTADMQECHALYRCSEKPAWSRRNIMDESVFDNIYICAAHATGNFFGVYHTHPRRGTQS
jgi:hypothetical protein